MKKFLVISLIGLAAAPSIAHSTDTNFTGFYVGGNIGIMTQPVATENQLSYNNALTNVFYSFPYNMTLQKTTGSIGLDFGYDCHLSEYKLATDLGININFGDANRRIPGTIITANYPVAILEDILDAAGGALAEPLNAKLPPDAMEVELKKQYAVDLKFKPGIRFANYAASFYGIVGGSFASFRYKATIGPELTTDTRRSVEKSFQALGLTLGVGLEYHFTPSISANLEYAHTRYKNLKTNELTYATVNNDIVKINSNFVPAYNKISAGLHIHF